MTSNVLTAPLVNEMPPRTYALVPRRRSRETVAIAVSVAALHLFGIYWLTHQSSAIVLHSVEAAQGSHSVAVNLVSRQQPVEPVRPVPPVEKPVVKTVEKPVPLKAPPKLATSGASTRDIQAPVPPAAANPEPAPVPQQNAPSPAQPQPQSQLADNTGESKATLATKQISSSELKQLGCQIPQPDYPAKAKRLAQEGVVTMNVTIATDGRVTHAAVAQSSGFPLLDSAAVTALQAGRCQPYMDGGRPRQVEASQAIAFHITE
jgi:periplasmic protein TonB